MDFFLFLLVNFTLFLRPGELISALAWIPIYNILILAALAAALPRLGQKLHPAALARQPITVCVLLLLPAIVLSHLSNFIIWRVQPDVTQFSKVVVYYLLLITVVHTTDRLRRFLSWLAIFTTLTALVAILHFYHVIYVPSLTVLEYTEMYDENGMPVMFRRMQATGIFGDPNDLSMISVFGIVVATFGLTDKSRGGSRYLWLFPLAVLLLTVVLTKSRGGTLALGAAVATAAYFRYGMVTAGLLLVLLLPVAALTVAGRGDAMAGGTGQSRSLLWAIGLSYFRQRPLFGIGYGTYAEAVGMDAHNSFVQCLTELGLFGGGLFVGAFWFAVLSVYKLGTQMRETMRVVTDARFRRFFPYLLGILAGFMVSMISLSRSYVVPTYLVLGLVNSYSLMAQARGVPAPVPATARRFAELLPLSVGVFAAAYIFNRLTL